jgi:hypothetical protein
VRLTGDEDIYPCILRKDGFAEQIPAESFQVSVVKGIRSHRFRPHLPRMCSGPPENARRKIEVMPDLLIKHWIDVIDSEPTVAVYRPASLKLPAKLELPIRTGALSQDVPFAILVEPPLTIYTEKGSFYVA